MFKKIKITKIIYTHLITYNKNEFLKENYHKVGNK